jgi:hypothetical protein
MRLDDKYRHEAIIKGDKTRLRNLLAKYRDWIITNTLNRENSDATNSGIYVKEVDNAISLLLRGLK